MAAAADLNLPPPGPEWFPGSVRRLGVPASAVLSAAGRFAVVASEERGWTFYVHPVRVISGAVVRDTTPGAAWIGSGTVARALDAPGGSLVERWVVGLDLPLAVWEVTSEPERDVTLEWTTSPRRGGSGSFAATPGCDLADDGRRASITTAVGPRVEIVASSARLREASGGSARGAHLRCEGRTPVRVLFAAAADAAGIARVADALRRAGSDPTGARRRHEEQAERSAPTAHTPDSLLDEAFQWAARRLDVPVNSVRAAVAQLMVGQREPVRERIRVLASSAAQRSPLPPQTPIDRLGLSSEGDPAAFLRLVERYAAWSGDLEFLRRHEPAIAALSASHMHGHDALAPAALLDRLRAFEAPSAEPPPLAESARAFLADPARLDAAPAAAVVESVLLGLWGVEPDALREAVTLRPAPPTEWPETTLRRLRVGRTTLDLVARRRRADLLVRVHRVFGPRILVTLAPRGHFAGAVVDEVELGAARARFEAGDRHEVLFRGVPV